MTIGNERQRNSRCCCCCYLGKTLTLVPVLGMRGRETVTAAAATSEKLWLSSPYWEQEAEKRLLLLLLPRENSDSRPRIGIERQRNVRCCCCYLGKTLTLIPVLGTRGRETVAAAAATSEKLWLSSPYAYLLSRAYVENWHVIPYTPLGTYFLPNGTSKTVTSDNITKTLAAVRAAAFGYVILMYSSYYEGRRASETSIELVR
jgi:hypothetical protein